MDGNPIQTSDDSLKHSVWGIVSFIMDIVAVEFELLVVCIRGTHPDGMDGNPVTAIILVLLLIGGVSMVLLGASFGIVGLFEKNRKKVFPVLGVIINGLIILVIIGLAIFAFPASIA